MKERDDAEKKESLDGGLVKVDIVNVSNEKPAQFYQWIERVAQAVGENFRVKSYYQTSRRTCSLTFYGVYVNAQLAAYAFKVVLERVSVMMQEKSNTVKIRNTYANGIAEGLRRFVEVTRAQEEERRRKKLEKARLSVKNGEAYEESDNDSDGDDDDHQEGAGYSFPDENPNVGSGSNCASLTGTGGGDKLMTKPNGASSSDEVSNVTSIREKRTADASKRLEELERQEEAALVLSDVHEKAADEVLKERKVKLKKGRKMTAVDRRSAAYNDGIEDSKKIDMNQRAIRDGVRVKKEKAR